MFLVKDFIPQNLDAENCKMKPNFLTQFQMIALWILALVGYVIFNLADFHPSQPLKTTQLKTPKLPAQNLTQIEQILGTLKSSPAAGKMSNDEDYRDYVGLSQENPKLIQFVRNHHLFPPSDKPYNLGNNRLVSYDDDRIHWQSVIVRHLLRNMSNGYFIECGAYDGESGSNTLYLERKYHWTGILIEPQYKVVSILRGKNRKAWIVDTALSPTTKFEMMSFNHIDYDVASGLDGLLSPKTKGRPAETQHVSDVPCLPIFSILLALNVSEVDYFSLDVEGAELNVLQTIPFDKVFIKIFSIEIQFLTDNRLDDFLVSKNYTKLMRTHIDDIYVHNAADLNKDPFPGIVP